MPEDSKSEQRSTPSATTSPAEPKQNFFARLFKPVSRLDTDDVVKRDDPAAPLTQAEVDGGPIDGTTVVKSTPIFLAHPIYFGFMMAVGVGIALGLFFIVSNVTQLLVWMLTAIFIALGLDPIVRWLEKRKVPRPLGIVIILLALIALVGGFFATLIPTIVDQTTQLVNAAPGWVSNILHSDWYHGLDQQFNLQGRVTDELGKFAGNSAAVTSLLGNIVNVGSSIANALFGTLIVVVLTLYFLASLPAFKKWAYKLAPRSRRQKVGEISERITSSVGNYVIGQACVAICNSLFALIVMTIVKVPFNFLMAFLVALLAFIPLVGGAIALVVVTLVALTASWQTALIFAICYIAYLQFEAYFVSPRIMQKAVSVPGAVAVIAVIAGGSLLDVLGALIAIPAAAAIMLLIKEVFMVRQNRH